MTADDDRLDRVQQRAFERAVANATAEVSQRLAALHRRRLVTQTAAVVAVIVACIGLLVMVATRDAVQAQAQANAQHNCALLTNIAAIMGSGNASLQLNGVPQGYVSSDAKLHRELALNAAQLAAIRPGPLKRLLSDPETTRLTKLSRVADSQTTSYWTAVLIPALKHLAKTDCDAIR